MALYMSPSSATDAEVAAAVAAEAVARVAADLLEQDAATAATDTELGAAVVALEAALALKQDAATAATDAELAAAVATLDTAIGAKQDSATAATDAELAAAVATLNTAVGLKQDASSAATDAELASAVAGVVTLTPATSARNVIQPTATNATPLVVKAIASQSVNAQEWQSSAGGVLALVSVSGRVHTASSLAAGTTSGITNVQLSAIATAATSVPIVGRGAASQSANLLELQDSAAVVRASFAPTGALSIGDTSQTTPMLLVSGGSAGAAMIRLTRDTSQYSWALSGGGLSFTDNTNSAQIVGLFGGSSVNEMYLGSRASTAVLTRPSLLSATTHQVAAGTDVAGQDLRLQGGLGTGAGVPGDVEFWTGNVAASGVVHTTTVKARIDPAGDLAVLTAGKGVILKSPDGLVTKKLTIDNAGALALI